MPHQDNIIELIIITLEVSLSWNFGTWARHLTPLHVIRNHDLHQLAAHYSQSSSPLVHNVHERGRCSGKEKLDSLNTHCLECNGCHRSCLWRHSLWNHLCSNIIPGHIAGHRDWYSTARHLLMILLVVHRLPKGHIVSFLRREAVVTSFALGMWSKWWCSPGLIALLQEPRLLWCRHPIFGCNKAHYWCIFASHAPP